MMHFNTWFTFFLMMTAIAYTPGPMTMFAMSSSIKNGFCRTLPGIFGGSAAYLMQMGVVYLGLGVIVQESVLVFNTIKWIGVIYLVVLGIRQWRHSIVPEDQLNPVSDRRSLLKQFSLGWATGMSNPKSVLVFTVLFPQFIDPAHYQSHFAVLSVSFFFIQGSSAFVYALFGARVFQWMRQRHLEKLQSRITGIILVLAGGILTLSKR